jgi:hypothetical protein
VNVLKFNLVGRLNGLFTVRLYVFINLIEELLGLNEMRRKFLKITKKLLSELTRGANWNIAMREIPNSTSTKSRVSKSDADESEYTQTGDELVVCLNSGVIPDDVDT